LGRPASEFFSGESSLVNALQAANADSDHATAGGVDSLVIGMNAANSTEAVFDYMLAEQVATQLKLLSRPAGQ
jgi:hypothetical protein